MVHLFPRLHHRLGVGVCRRGNSDCLSGALCHPIVKRNLSYPQRRPDMGKLYRLAEESAEQGVSVAASSVFSPVHLFHQHLALLQTAG